MRHPLQRLYETKLALVATVFTFLGLALLILAHGVVNEPALVWLTSLPLTDVGSALFTTGLVVIVFEYLDKQDGEERATQRLRQVLKEQAPAMRDAVIDGFAFDAEDLKRVSSPEVLDRITRSSLAIQLGDQAFAEEVYEDLRDQVIRAGERLHDLQVTVGLSHWERGTSTTSAPLLVATIRWEYTGVLTESVRRFACVSDAKEYRDLLQEPANSSVWRFIPVEGLDADSPEAFELVQFSIDGTERPIRRTARDGSQVYSVSAGTKIIEAGRSVRVAYTYRTLVRRDGHLLYLSLSQPTKGLSVELRYGGVGIRSVSVLDFIASSRKTMIQASAPSLPEPTVGVSFDGWALPQSGVAFVWTLDAETSSADHRKPATTGTARPAPAE
jgi:hypothetical protein